MNPNTSIRPWLLACGAQLGINSAYDHHNDDADTRRAEKFFTYRVVSTEPKAAGVLNLNAKTGNNLARRGCMSFRTTVEITLHNCQDGVYILGACWVGANHSPDIRGLLSSSGAIKDVLLINDESIVNDGDIEYIHRMIVTFDEWIEISIDEINSVIDDISLTVESGGYTWAIDDTGYE